jgi:hypothetical protein
MTQPLFIRLEGDDKEIEYLNISDASSIVIKGDSATIHFNDNEKQSTLIEDKKAVKSLRDLLDRLTDYKERVPASLGLLAGKVSPKRD